MFYIIFLFWLFLDQFTKNYVQHHFTLGQSIPVIPNFFHLTYILNRGAAFGILSNQRVFFLLIAFILVLLCWYFRKQIRSKGVSLIFGTAILLAGTVGNAYDRYTYGAVIDFFDFRIWPIFNIADIGICVGVIIIAWHIWKSGN